MAKDDIIIIGLFNYFCLMGNGFACSCYKRGVALQEDRKREIKLTEDHELILENGTNITTDASQSILTTNLDNHMARAGM